MPFTLAHPAAVWPLKFLRPHITIPLVVGSMMPDLVNYLPDAHGLINSHSMRGSVMIDLPLGYLLLMALITLRKLLLSPLWEPHRSFIDAEFRHFIALKLWWILALPLLLVGTWTHLLWDSFTHENHFMVRKLPILRHSLALDGEHPLYLYHLLQYGCSVLGVLFVVWWYVTELRKCKLPASHSSLRKYLLISLIVISMGTGLIYALYILANWGSAYWFISVILTTAMPVFAGLYCVIGFVFWWRETSHASK